MPEKVYEFQVEIDGVNYGMDRLVNVHITQPLFDQFSVGLACSAQMEVTYRFDLDPSRGAKLVPRYRVQGSNDLWKQIGVYYIDLREDTRFERKLICFDSMMKADIQYFSSGGSPEGDPGEWPRSMIAVTNEIAQRMGIEIDPRTTLNPDYTVEYPNDVTCRTILGWVAAANVGNWVITPENKLLLVPMFAKVRVGEFLIVDEKGNTIFVGGESIGYAQFAFY